MEKQELGQNQLYAVQLNGLHVGTVASFYFKGSRQYDYRTRKYIPAKVVKKLIPIGKLVHSTSGVGIVQLTENKNRQYWQAKFSQITYKVPFDTVVTIVEVPNAN